MTDKCAGLGRKRLARDVETESPQSSCIKTARVRALHSSHLELAVSSTPCVGCNGRCLDFGGEKTIRLSRSLVGPQVQIHSGDTIRLALPRATLIGLSSLVYLLPVMLMLLFAIACDLLLKGSELTTAIAALIGLLSGIAICRIVSVQCHQAIRSHISVTSDT